ncbi:hypothetical protein IHE44_0001963 [Lamprotornis superbus]|uniref:Cation-transporting ATPase n=1 Tax=Lamprotornis superbus TaxID=245042 RepID=A0A835NRS8_9PASS|nr:hypothetical protein IHE44_0001963 [Lamprotornis superbus]
MRHDIFGYKTQGCRKALCIAGYILSCGALRLLFYWKPEWHDDFRIYSRKTVTWISVYAFIKSRSDYPATEEDSIFSKAIMKPSLQVKTIHVQKIRYVWNIYAKQFQKQSIKLHKLVESHNNIMVTVCRNKEGFQDLESHHLVPGDMLILKEGKTLLPCDAILVSGQCTVNESMLTGESIPVTKTHLPRADNFKPWRVYCAEDYRKHVLFCGTEVIQAKADDRGVVRAVVLRTGFNTAKGDLVRSILYPKPMNFKLYRDALRFLMCLIAFAAIGMIYTVCVFALNGEETGEVVKKALDVITIAVPPALPAALTTGIIYTQQRLKKKGIFCISPQRINICGQLNLVCFDKDIHSFPADHSLPWGPLFKALAVCHSLIVWKGKIQGDPLDVKMFEATNWVIDDSSIHQIEGQGSIHATVVRPGLKATTAPVEGIAILHQFPFSSALQRMSVIAQEIGGNPQAFIKGAPEIVAMLCRAETVPSNFESKLLLYTAQGFRVIGLACKSLQGGKLPAALTREEVESDLTFLGLLIMENRLKRETKPVLEELSAARIRSVMVTGDNIQTAITVAKNAGMIAPTHKEDDSQTEPRIKVALGSGQYHFAMSGKSYQIVAQHFRHLLPKQLNSFGNYQFLFQDLAITTVIGVTSAYPKLVPYRPPSQLISPPLLLSVVLNILFSLSMQIFGFVVVQEQPWYSKTDIHSACLPVTSHERNSSSSLALHGVRDGAHEQTDNGFKSYENTTVWLLSTINCLIVALVFSKGKPFRQPIYTNYVFILVLIGQLGICLFLMFADIDDLYSKMDEAVIENRPLWLFLKKTFQYHSKSHYKRLQHMLEQDSAWPPLNETFFSDSVAVTIEGNMGGHSNPTFDSMLQGGPTEEVHTEQDHSPPKGRQLK